MSIKNILLEILNIVYSAVKARDEMMKIFIAMMLATSAAGADVAVKSFCSDSDASRIGRGTGVYCWCKEGKNWSYSGLNLDTFCNDYCPGACGVRD